MLRFSLCSIAIYADARFRHYHGSSRASAALFTRPHISFHEAASSACRRLEKKYAPGTAAHEPHFQHMMHLRIPRAASVTLDDITLAVPL